MIFLLIKNVSFDIFAHYISCSIFLSMLNSAKNKKLHKICRRIKNNVHVLSVTLKITKTYHLTLTLNIKTLNILKHIRNSFMMFQK